MDNLKLFVMLFWLAVVTCMMTAVMWDLTAYNRQRKILMLVSCIMAIYGLTIVGAKVLGYKEVGQILDMESPSYIKCSQ